MIVSIKREKDSHLHASRDDFVSLDAHQKCWT